MSELLRYVGFDEADAARLRAFAPLAAPKLPAIAQSFYERIREHEGAHAVFVDEHQIARLHHSMKGWLERVLSGDYDARYWADTRRIGVVHVRVGLPQHYMFTAMAQLRTDLAHVADAALPSPERERTRDALSKILDVDLAIMVGSYAEAMAERLRKVEQRPVPTVATEAHVAAVELARWAMLGVDGDGVVRLVNREVERLTGLARDELVGEKLERLFAAPTTAKFGAALQAARASDAETDDGPVILDAPLRARTGGERLLRWQLVHAPQFGLVFATGYDWTEEHANEERTRRVEKLAAVGTLAAGLAHEIRNPLNGAQLHAAYLARALTKQRATPEMLDAVSVIGSEIQRLAALTTEFLDFAHPKPLTYEQVSARALTQRVFALTEPVAREAGVQLTLDVPQRDVVFDGDVARLEQVLLNLVRNAVEATVPNGKGSVVLRVRRKPREAVFEVEDDGTGIASSSPIFDAFYSTKPHGTGLGLAITHRIVSDHGGSIEVKSQPGRTVFTVALPLLRWAPAS
jgi:PAS domain S-box-containing protein